NKSVIFPSRWGKPPPPLLAWHASCPIPGSHRPSLGFPQVLGKTVWRVPVIIDTFCAWAFCLSLGQRHPFFLESFHTRSSYLVPPPCVSMSEFVPLSKCSLSILHLWRWHSSLVCVPSINFMAIYQRDIDLWTTFLHTFCQRHGHFRRVSI